MDFLQISWFEILCPGEPNRKSFYPSNLAPIYFDCLTGDESLDGVLDYFNNSGVLDQPGGVPTSDIRTGQQWDFPNIWAPLVKNIQYFG